MPFSFSFWRASRFAFAFAMLVVLLSGCTGSSGSSGGNTSVPRVDAEGFGGGGALDKAHRRLLNQLEKYTQSGLPSWLCMPVADCTSYSNSKQCLLLGQLTESQRITCRHFIKDHLSSVLASAKTVALATTENPLTLTLPDGSTRSVDAQVPLAMNKILVRSSAVSDNTYEDLTALLMHEFLHLPGTINVGSQVGDFETFDGIVARDLFDYIGAAVAVDSARPVSEFRKEVIKDLPQVYYGFDEPSGMSIAHDIAGNGRNGTLTGDLSLAVATVKEQGTAAKFFQQGNMVVDFSSTPLALGNGRQVSVELLLNAENFAGSGVILSWDGMSLAFSNNVLGFSSSGTQIAGTDVNDYSRQWLHVIAIFDSRGPCSGELYINGQQRDLDRIVGGCPDMGGGVLETTHLYVNGVSDSSRRNLFSIDELSVYAGELSLARISAHYAKLDLSPLEPSAISETVLGSVEGTIGVTAWDEFTCIAEVCTYEFGRSSLSNISSYIGINSSWAGHGYARAQKFRWTNLTVGKKYELSLQIGYHIITPGLMSATSATYSASAGEGEVQFLSGRETAPASGYYPGRWVITFTALRPGVTLSLSNPMVYGIDAIYLDAVTFKPLP